MTPQNTLPENALSDEEIAETLCQKLFKDGRGWPIDKVTLSKDIFQLWLLTAIRKARSVVAGVEEKWWTVEDKDKYGQSMLTFGNTFVRLDTSLARKLRDAHNYPPRQKWSPIESAPKDGTAIDLLYNGQRWTDCFWGKPDHSCGEAGEYCDSDWHHIRHPGWVYSLFDEFLQGEPTHWMPLPSVPDGTEEHLVAPLKPTLAASPVSSVEQKAEQDLRTKP